MKTAVTQTSIDAYYSINLTEQQKEVLTAIRVLGETCIADVATYLGWERSTVSGRMNDLKKAN
jgi:DNA-binding MarR family transcriptional regulator